MYVILTQDVPQLGNKNSLVNVAKGYFMNFLSPRKLAHVASAQMIEGLRESILAQKESAAQIIKGDAEHAQALKGAKVVLKRKASAKGTLFKAVTAAELVVAISDQFHFDLEPSQLIMDQIKKVGDHAVAVTFGDITVEIKLVIEAEMK